MSLDSQNIHVCASRLMAHLCVSHFSSVCLSTATFKTVIKASALRVTSLACRVTFVASRDKSRYKPQALWHLQSCPGGVPAHWYAYLRAVSQSKRGKEQGRGVTPEERGRAGGEHGRFPRLVCRGLPVSVYHPNPVPTMS